MNGMCTVETKDGWLDCWRKQYAGTKHLSGPYEKYKTYLLEYVYPEEIANVIYDSIQLNYEVKNGIIRKNY